MTNNNFEFINKCKVSYFFKNKKWNL
jgi:hypothetical protein